MKKIMLILLIGMVGVTLLLADPVPVFRGTNSHPKDPTNSPFNLQASVVGNTVHLMWQNPQFAQTPRAFRIYCNSICIRTIFGENVTFCAIENCCPGMCVFYVCALFEEAQESPPSNQVEIMITANDDAVAPAGETQLYAYPNPFRSDVEMGIRGAAEKGVSQIVIYNQKGQMVWRASLAESSRRPWHWNGTDLQGKPVSAGVYYLKAVVGNHTHSLKLMLIR